MKRILFFMLMQTITMVATAQTLKICGTSIDLTKNTLSATSGVTSGNYSYYYGEKLLVLNNVTISRSNDNGSTNDYGIYSTIPDLRISFKGTCTINTKASGIFLERSTSISNQGTVRITTSNRGIYIKGGSTGYTITINGGTWDITGDKGIEGEKKNDVVNLYDDAQYPLMMNVKGTNGCIIDLKSMSIPSGFAYVSPLGDLYSFYSSIHAVGYDSSTPVKNKNVIIAQKTFRLGGGIWTTWHPDINFSAHPNISGSGSYPVSYNKSTKTVTLNNATISSSTDYVYFEPYLDNMTLNLIGTNTISDDNELSPGLLFYPDAEKKGKNLTIKGTGTLNTTSIAFDNTIMYDGYLDISGGAKVNVTNNKNTYPGIKGVTYVVRVYESTLNINAKSSAECTEARIELHGSVISSPTSIVRMTNEFNMVLNPVMDESRCNFYDLDRTTRHKGSLKIVPGIAYDLWVNGVQVNSENKGNLSSVLNNAGSSCSYVPTTKTLYLSNARISYNDDRILYPAIYNKINGLVINNSGTSEIGGNNMGIESEADFTITGNGHLKVTGTRTGTDNLYGAIRLQSCDLTVDNTELTATGGKYAIYASEKKNGKGNVILNNSYLHLSGENRAVWVNTFDPCCYIASPVNGYIGGGYIYQSNGSISKVAEIEPSRGIVTTIDAVAPVEEGGETSFYTTSGILVWKGKGKPQLPSGLYIINQGGKTRKVQF